MWKVTELSELGCGGALQGFWECCRLDWEGMVEEGPAAAQTWSPGRDWVDSQGDGRGGPRAQVPRILVSVVPWKTMFRNLAFLPPSLMSCSLSCFKVCSFILVRNVGLSGFHLLKFLFLSHAKFKDPTYAPPGGRPCHLSQSHSPCRCAVQARCHHAPASQSTSSPPVPPSAL